MSCDALRQYHEASVDTAMIRDKISIAGLNGDVLSETGTAPGPSRKPSVKALRRDLFCRAFREALYRRAIRSKNRLPVSADMAGSHRNKTRSNHLAGASIQHRNHCIDRTTDMHRLASFHLRYDRIQDM